MRDKKSILITGGAGFIGSNFISYYLEKYPNDTIINFHKLTYAGELSNLSAIENHQSYSFVKGDICDRVLIENLFETYKFTNVIHFAAESHVDNSIKQPDAFIQTNVFGTFTLLDVAKNFWMDEPYQPKENLLPTSKYNTHQNGSTGQTSNRC